MIALLSLAGLGSFDREITIDTSSTAVPAPAASRSVSFEDQASVITGIAPPTVRAPLWPWLLAGGAVAVAWYFWQGGRRRGGGGPLG
jgi:hypothetical protein